MNNWLREWSSRQTDADRETTRSKVVVSVVTVVSNLVIGGSALVKADGGLETIGAAVLVAIGIAHSAELASQLPVFRRSNARLKPEPDKMPPRNSTVPKRGAYPYKRKEASIAFQHVIEQGRRRDAAEQIDTRGIGMSREALFFYAGWAVAILGVILSVIGLGGGLYPATLTGSILASLGFVTLACALVAGKEADDRADDAA